MTRLYPRPGSGNAFGRVFERRDEKTHTVFKVETHNHPTAISPFPGASTGSGGEIRDEGATGPRRPPEGGPLRLHDLEPQPAGTPAGL